MSQFKIRTISCTVYDCPLYDDSLILNCELRRRINVYLGINPFKSYIRSDSGDAAETSRTSSG